MFGVWAGSMTYVENKIVGVYIDQEKWDKTKDCIAWLKRECGRC